MQTTCPTCSRLNAVDPTRDEQPKCGACGALLPWHMQVSDQTLQALLARPMLNLLAFTSATCGPCQQQKPILKRVCALIDRQYPGMTRLLEADTDVCPTAVQVWSVTAVPTTFLVYGGQVPTVLARFDGLNADGLFVTAILESLIPKAQQ